MNGFIFYLNNSTCNQRILIPKNKIYQIEEVNGFVCKINGIEVAHKFEKIIENIFIKKDFTK